MLDLVESVLLNGGTWCLIMLHDVLKLMHLRCRCPLLNTMSQDQHITSQAASKTERTYYGLTYFGANEVEKFKQSLFLLCEQKLFKAMSCFLANYAVGNSLLMIHSDSQIDIGYLNEL